MSSAAIVGYGCVTHAGIGAPVLQSAFEAGSRAKKPAIAPPTEELNSLLSNLGFPRPPRASMMGLLAAREAWAAADLPPETDPDRVGVLINRNHGQHSVVEKYLSKVWESGAGSASGLVFVQTIANTVLGLIATQLQARGPSELFFGPSSLGLALDTLRADRANVILAGGLDECSDFTLATCESWKWVDFCPSEGASFIALENPLSAARRGATIHGFLRGYDLRFDRLGRRDPATRDPDDLADTILRSLEDARLDPKSISLVSRSGGAGVDGIDEAERIAIDMIFGDRVRVIDTKSVVGDAWGAACGIGFIGALLEGSPAAVVLTCDISGQNGAFVLTKEAS